MARGGCIIAAEVSYSYKPILGYPKEFWAERTIFDLLHPDDAQRAELAALHARLESQVGRRDAFFATNEQFHMALLQIAGNRWALQIVTDLRKVMKLNRHHSLFKQGRLSDSLAEHRALMQAIEARNPAQARELMRAHFEHGLEAAAA